MLTSDYTSRSKSAVWIGALWRFYKRAEANCRIILINLRPARGIVGGGNSVTWMNRMTVVKNWAERLTASE